MLTTRACLLFILLFIPSALGATTVYTNQAHFMLALSNSRISKTPYYTPPGYPQQIISSPALTVYE